MRRTSISRQRDKYIDGIRKESKDPLNMGNGLMADNALNRSLYYHCEAYALGHRLFA